MPHSDARLGAQHISNLRIIGEDLWVTLLQTLDTTLLFSTLMPAHWTARIRQSCTPPHHVAVSSATTQMVISTQPAAVVDAGGKNFAKNVGKLQSTLFGASRVFGATGNPRTTCSLSVLRRAQGCSWCSFTLGPNVKSRCQIDCAHSNLKDAFKSNVYTQHQPFQILRTPHLHPRWDRTSWRRFRTCGAVLKRRQGTGFVRSAHTWNTAWKGSPGVCPFLSNKHEEIILNCQTDVLERSTRRNM